MNDLDGEGSKEKITRKKNANNDEENEKFTGQLKYYYYLII